jgi:hypothetical protein
MAEAMRFWGEEGCLHKTHMYDLRRRLPPMDLSVGAANINQVSLVTCFSRIELSVGYDEALTLIDQGSVGIVSFRRAG